jgi:hypothetical protein
MKTGEYRLEKIQHGALLVGLAGAAGGLVGAWLATPQFFMSYLFAYLFWFGISIGALGILMMHHVTGGAWGDLIKPQLEAAAGTLPLLLILFLPILAGMKTLYPWARPEVVAADPVLQHKHVFLNVPFFALRGLGCLALWSFMGYRLNLWSVSDPARARRHSAPGLVLYTFSVSVAVLDWMMSLEPRWYSTIYEALVIIGFMLGAFAFVTLGLYVLQSPEDRASEALIKPYWDLGNMLLAFVMFWAYMSFSQYLIIWSANIPEEISWYLHRQQGGWFVVAMILVGFQFFLPFLALLNRSQKQRLDRLARVAAILLPLNILYGFWLVRPSFSPDHFQAHVLDLVLLAGVGGLWLAVFLSRLRTRPAVVGTYIPESHA